MFGYGADAALAALPIRGGAVLTLLGKGNSIGAASPGVEVT